MAMSSIGVLMDNINKCNSNSNVWECFVVADTAVIISKGVDKLWCVCVRGHEKETACIHTVYSASGCLFT